MKKRIILLVTSLILMTTSIFSMAKENAFTLSSHILDISKGIPAHDVTVILEKRQANGEWQLLEKNKTDKNGRLSFLNSKDQTTAATEGVYKLRFETLPYFEKNNVKSFYPYIEVVFEIKDSGQHYHVPITLSPFGYSTYRGS